MEKLVALGLVLALEYLTGGWPVIAKPYKRKIRDKLLIVLDKLESPLLLIGVITIVFGIAFGVEFLVADVCGPLGTIVFYFIVLATCLGNSNIDEQQSAFVLAHEQSFGVLFWFIVIGPAGALLYWLLMLVSYHGDIIISSAHALAGWVSARVTAFLYALVGNFGQGFSNWLRCMKTVNMQSSEVLMVCGQAAGDELEQPAVLVRRAFVSWIILYIIFWW